MNDDLDAELAAAAGLSGEGGTAKNKIEQAVVSRSSKEHPPTAEPKPRRHWALLASLLLIVGITLTAFMVGFDDVGTYSMKVDEFVARGNEMLGRRVRLEGELVPGSLRHREQPCEFRFELRGGSKNLAVSYPRCVVPDGFHDAPDGGVQVSVEGKLVESGGFEAKSLMTKCGSKYEPMAHQVDPDS